MVSRRIRHVFTLALGLTPFLAYGQVRQIGAPKPSPHITIGDSVTVTATPSAVSFQLVAGGVALASNPIVVTTAWSGISLLSSVNVYAYFGSSTAALSGSSPIVNIPSSLISGKDATGIPTSFTPFSQAVPVAGASLQLYSLSSLLSLGGSHTDTLTLQIDLTTLPQLPAAVYTGVLYFQAQAF